MFAKDFSFFLRGGGGGLEISFMPSLSISYFRISTKSLVTSSYSLNVILSPVTEKSFLESITKFQKTYSFLTGCEFLRFVVRHMDIKHMRHSFIPKNSDISLKISILNFFHLASFPSFSCKVVLPISLDNPKDTA